MLSHARLGIIRRALDDLQLPTTCALPEVTELTEERNLPKGRKITKKSSSSLTLLSWRKSKMQISVPSVSSCENIPRIWFFFASIVHQETKFLRREIKVDRRPRKYVFRRMDCSPLFRTVRRHGTFSSVTPPPPCRCPLPIQFLTKCAATSIDVHRLLLQGYRGFGGVPNCRYLKLFGAATKNASKVICAAFFKPMAPCSAMTRILIAPSAWPQAGRLY